MSKELSHVTHKRRFNMLMNNEEKIKSVNRYSLAKTLILCSRLSTGLLIRTRLFKASLA